MAETSFAEKVKAELTRKSFTSDEKEGRIEDKRARLRDLFLRSGTMSDPVKSYHLEFVCGDREAAEEVRQLLSAFEIRSGVSGRKGHSVVYLKDGAAIAQLLNVIGAHVSLMEMENLRIYKEMRGKVNRRVNCDAANITKAVNAASIQTDAIHYLQAHHALKKLPQSLQDAARARMEAPEATLAEIASRMQPPLTKSGMNHRLQKIVDAAKRLREETDGKDD